MLRKRVFRPTSQDGETTMRRLPCSPALPDAIIPQTSAHLCQGGTPPQPMIRFTDIHLPPAAKGTLTVQVRVHYDGSRGYPVIASARLLDGWKTIPWATAPPVPIPHGSAAGQLVTFALHFA